MMNHNLNILVFDDGKFPVMPPQFRCVVITSIEKTDVFLRKTTVDIAFVGQTESSPMIAANIITIHKWSPTAVIIAIVQNEADAEIAFGNGVADCILRDQLSPELVAQRIAFSLARTRFLKHGGENQLYTQADLAAITRILSHDIRNTLSGIVLSVDPIKEACTNNSEAKGYVDILERASAKLSQLINRFSTATGNIALKSKNENLVDVLRHSVATFPESGGKTLKIIEDYSRAEIFYPIDRDKFPLAITNLLANAADAVEGTNGAQIQVKAEVVDRDILLKIADNGHGIDITTLQNVFRPFFTTRPGKSGLGLPLAKSIINAHGGQLRIESGNSGTTVICRFPFNE